MSACGRWLVVFGGLRNRACLNDAAALDTERMVWQPLEVEGARPPARGNHAAVVLSTAGAHRLWVFGGDAPGDERAAATRLLRPCRRRVRHERAPARRLLLGRLPAHGEG